MSSTAKRPSRSALWAVALVLATVASLFVYESYGRRKPPAAAPWHPVVRTTEIVPASELETKSFPGVAKESQIAKLSFRVAGKLLDSRMTVGARIAKDEIIAKLDPRDYQLAVKRFEAELQAAESLLSAMKTGARSEDIASLQSQLAAAESALETAETNLNRFTALLADQVASQAQFDLAKTRYDEVKGKKETLANELEKARTGARKEDIDAMEAKILGLKAALNTARNALDDTILKAPFDGMIVEKYIEDYEVIAPGVPIVSFVNVAQIDIAVNLPEEMIIRLNDIRSYQVEFEAYSGRIFPATLKELGRAIQRGRQSYPLQVRIDLPPEDEQRPLFPGMTATVHIGLARKTQPQSVPLASLFGKDDQSGLWSIEPLSDRAGASREPLYKVVRRPVKLLQISGEAAEIESDLEPGERIVVAGAKFLRENQTVRLDPTP